MNSKTNSCIGVFASLFLLLAPAVLHAEASDDPAMKRKLQAIVLPKVELDDVTLVEAIKFFRDQSRLNDAEKKGVNVILRNSADADMKVTMNLTKVSLLDALRKLSTTTGLPLKIQRYGAFLGSAKEHK